MGACFYVETSEDPYAPLPWPHGVNTVIFGRDPGLFLQLNDDQASRRHASLRRRFGKYVLRDQNSRNGTLVNGLPVLKRTLQNGDRIQIGRTVIRFSLAEDAAPSDSPGVALTDDRVSLLAMFSVGLAVLGVVWWPFAAAAFVLGAVAALNVRLRPKLRGFGLALLGAGLGGGVFGAHYGVKVVGRFVEVSKATKVNLECKRRLIALRDGLLAYQADHAERTPKRLRDLFPRYVGKEGDFYCPGAEKRLGVAADGAAYVYRPPAERRKAGGWIVRDPDLDAHQEGGHIIDIGDRVRWLTRPEFAELLREDAP